MFMMNPEYILLKDPRFSSNIFQLRQEKINSCLMAKNLKKYAEIIFRWLKTIGVGLIIVFGGLTLAVVIRDHDKRMSPFKPMISEAKELKSQRLKTFKPFHGIGSKIVG